MTEGKFSKEDTNKVEQSEMTWIEWLCQIEGHEFLISVDAKFVKLVVTSEDYEEIRGEWRHKYTLYEEAVEMI